MNRPDVDAVLRTLKRFQRNTVEHAFRRMFLDPDGTDRFLVADEVGLGKTLVARGIIAKAIDHLWNDVKRIDVLYICSNGSIARQNLDKLRVSGAGERSMALATRLTMLATQLAPVEGRPTLANSRVNFVSFTPGTSFEMGSSTGWSGEREVLFALVQPHIDRWIPLANLLQGNVTNHVSWRNRLHSPRPIEPGIRERFDRALLADEELLADIHDALDWWFHRIREQWPDDVRWARNQIIARLRRMLAKVSIDALEPDLVILDEFQRFKGLLETRPDKQDHAATLAQALFNAETPEGAPVRTLLLSATPYKLYTADAEIDHEDHYQDFLDTTRFLLADDEVRVAELKRNLCTFGRALKAAANGVPVDVDTSRRAVQDTLTSVMARTERVGDTEERDSMVAEPVVQTAVARADVRQYLAADALFQAVGDRDPMSFWKAAPYLPHFMSGYRFNRRLDETLELAPEKVAAVLRRFDDAWLDDKAIACFGEVAPQHAKLRSLMREIVEGGQWSMLWMPPTVPYWPLGGAFDGRENETKTLLFSAWNVVPDAVCALVSYEVERRMAGGRLDAYAEPARQQGPLLRLTPGEGGRRAAHRNLLLLMPCLPLADEAHPLGAPPEGDRIEHVRARVRGLLEGLPDPSHGDVDRRWEYVLPLLLDPGLRRFLADWRDASDDVERPNPEQFGDYIDDLLAVEATDLGRRPDGLEGLALALALGSPGVLSARLTARRDLDPTTRRRLAKQAALAFWSLFNGPTVITLLRQFSADDTPYWRAVLDYCRDGNLQAVLDESWHLLWEQHAWAEERTPFDIAQRCTVQLAGSVVRQRARVEPIVLRTDDSGRVKRSNLTVRMTLAQRFGQAKTDNGQRITQDAVRDAFNSPFRPFLLASTSVGQEGLDFHPWCHRLVHWNLPGNPVDLEQREGRVHRYKGHALRRNVALQHALAALAGWSPGDDLWAEIFRLADLAARRTGASDLVPYWIAPGPTKVIRHVPLLPWTKEVEAFARLKRQLAAYRVVFGQPRQEELLRLLEGADLERLRDWTIDLTPPSAHRTCLSRS
jgi:hypothetical protein